MNRIALSLAFALSLAACTTEDKKEPPPTKTSLASASTGDLTVELLSEGPLSTGLTPIYLRISSAGQPVTDADVTFTPVMAMVSSPAHGCPILGPPTVDADGLYHFDMVFNMASGAMGSWSASVGVTRPAAALVEVVFADLSVSDSGRAKSFSYTDNTDPLNPVVTKYSTSLNFEGTPRVGLNPVIFTLFRMDGPMIFTPVDDATLVLDPQMPSMGHGSPGSVNPTLSTTSGVYEGELSFSMAGDWETTVTVTLASVPLLTGAPKFLTTF